MHVAHRYLVPGDLTNTVGETKHCATVKDPLFFRVRDELPMKDNGGSETVIRARHDQL